MFERHIGCVSLKVFHARAFRTFISSRDDPIQEPGYSKSLTTFSVLPVLDRSGESQAVPWLFYSSVSLSTDADNFGMCVTIHHRITFQTLLEYHIPLVSRTWLPDELNRKPSLSQKGQNCRLFLFTSSKIRRMARMWLVVNLAIFWPTHSDWIWGGRLLGRVCGFTTWLWCMWG